MCAGSEFDQINATGTATLGGALQVDLIALGGGLFDPSLGDVFSILTAETLDGEFDVLVFVDPLAVGLEWQINYLIDFDGSTDAVQLTVVPEPSTLVLALIALVSAILARRRRRRR